YKYAPDSVIRATISKTGLNRLSNPPYKITQVTGDESKYRLKHDEDGSNIYIMPLQEIGEDIEISIRNNAGFVQDLLLRISDTKGKVIIIDGKHANNPQQLQKSIVARMLRAMKDDIADIFYVQSGTLQLAENQELAVKQIKTYQYKNLRGGVFELQNTSKSSVNFTGKIFAQGFDGVIGVYPDELVVMPREKAKVMIVQEIKDK
ncbi:MAG: type-F conjugative transfer system secretin TraK, partial [Candidatus Parvarchaeum sp.]